MTLCVNEELVLIELVGAHFLLDMLRDNGRKERKRHDLAFEKLQRAKDEWNKRKAQKVKKGKELKVKIGKELMPIAWHPDRLIDWFIPEDEKKKI